MANQHKYTLSGRVTSGHVSLNRTFHELSRYASGSDDNDVLQAIYVGNSLTWEELLTEYRVVILSEAGSGKTEEIRQTAKRLRDEGKDAFFLRLENIPSHFEDAFEEGTVEQFDQWLASGREGWLLLDSVDEARLRHAHDFELAIKKLGNRIRLGLDRAHLILTGRASAWRPKTDLEKCKRYLPFAPIVEAATPDVAAGDADFFDFDEGEQSASKGRAGSTEASAEQNATAPFRIVTLDHLTKDQVNLFAQRRGIIDSHDFIDAIERADAWSFTTRPQDLEDLIVFWLDRRLIGGRLEIMRNSIERRLKERDQNRADTLPLSYEKALAGARLLAAATTLGSNPAIQVPDEAEDLQGISVEKVLPGWTASERKALLQRPVFDPPTYGAVRFHHRTVREYLTAEWLNELLIHPTSRRVVEDMFFKAQYGEEIVVPLTRPVLPWLALFDEKIRERVAKVAPEVLFEGGDPAALPLPLRRRILDDVTSEIAQSNTPKSPTSIAAVQRFANRDLGADIRRLLCQYEDVEDAAAFLLRMIWLGQINDALPEAKRQAFKATAGTYRRIAAFRAVKEVGAPSDIGDVRNAVLREATTIRREWVSELIRDLKAGEAEVRWLLSAISKAAVSQRYTLDMLGDAVEKFVLQAPVDQLQSLIGGFYELLVRPPHIDAGYAPVSKEFTWLLQSSVKALERLVVERNPASLSLAALGIIHMAHSVKHFAHDLRETKTDLPNLVPAWSELNRASFWFEIAEARRSRRGNAITSYWQASRFGQFWSFGADDFDYLLGEIHSRSVSDDKLVALSAASQSYIQGGRRRDQYERLKSATKDDPMLLHQFRAFMDPPPPRAISTQEARWQVQMKARERREKSNRLRAREQIRQQVDTIKDPGFNNPNDISRTQWYLQHQIREQSDRTGKWATGNWRALEPEFGEEVARAFRDGAIAHWRRAVPKLLSEGAEANQTPASVVFGLTGLAIDSLETLHWEQTLSREEALLAARYAMHELNGFPDWFPRLYMVHTDSISDFLMHEIEFEINRGGEEGMHYIVDDLAWSGQWAWPVLGPRILDLLQKFEPKNAEALNKLIEVVLNSAVDSASIGALVKRRLDSRHTLRHPVQWYTVWTGIDPEKAVPAFEKYLLGLPNEQAKSNAAMSYITHLFGDKHHEKPLARAAFRTPPILRDLYVLMHRYIRRADDIDRANGGVYSPTLRDKAQDARNAIFNVLNGIPGKDAYIAMIEIAEAESDTSTKSWIRFRAHEKAELEGNLAPWTPEQIRDFHDKQDRTPSNHTDLADLVVNRILDLKDDLENGDSSIARILMSVDEETDMRNFLGREFREKAAGRYCLSQEGEPADPKSTELRFQGICFDGPFPVETRLADNWTGTELFERLENQLSGECLGDRRSSRGAFLMVYQGNRATWELPNGRQMSFDGLVEALKKHWIDLSPSYPNVDELTIIGLDLTRQ
ncbi:hypothetical protein [Neorhizobium sp. DAR64861/K0K2]|uniref:hypothetical protein n=1 Tax=unclassified Neorhizobium TaxID=2629175 RepID=UPI003D270BF0